MTLGHRMRPKQTVDVAVIHELYGQESDRQTFKYVGFTADERANVYMLGVQRKHINRFANPYTATTRSRGITCNVSPSSLMARISLVR